RTTFARTKRRFGLNNKRIVFCDKSRLVTTCVIVFYFFIIIIKIIIYLPTVLGRYSSGQRGQTVNLLTTSSQVRILLSPRIHTKSKQNIKLAFLFCVFLYFQSVVLQDQRS